MALLPFDLPKEVFLTSLYSRYPCREFQIRSLATLLAPPASSPRNLVIYGSEATGKSVITSAVLNALSFPEDKCCNDSQPQVLDGDTQTRHAIIKSAECITGRHLFETTVAAVAKALDRKGKIGRCENLAQLVVEISKLLDGKKSAYKLPEKPSEKFILVFDGIDRQRDTPPTLLPALARLGESIHGLTILFIVTSPRPHFLHISCVPYLHFPAYTKSEVIRILALSAPPLYPSADSQQSFQQDLPQTQQTSAEIWPRFVSAVWDSLSKHAGRDIISLRNMCLRLWPAFTAQIRDGTYTTQEFSRILISKRSLLQDERVFIPSITSSFTKFAVNGITNGSTITESVKRSSAGLATQLPLISRLILTAAYLSSHTPSRFDTQLFSRASSLRKKKKGGGTALNRSRPGTSKHRKISRKLLGPQAFVLERMMAIFWTLAEDSNVWRRGGPAGLRGLAGSADVQMAVATLASLRLVVKTGGSADVLDASSKWKVNVGWDVVRGVARSVGVEIEDYLVD